MNVVPLLCRQWLHMMHPQQPNRRAPSISFWRLIRRATLFDLHRCDAGFRRSKRSEICSQQHPGVTLTFTPLISSSLPWPLNGNSGKQVYVYCQGCNPEIPDLWPVSLFHRGNNELIQEMCLLSKKNSDRMNHLSYSLVWYWRFVLRSPWTCTEPKFKMGKELAPPLLPDITKTICSKLFDVHFVK